MRYKIAARQLTEGVIIIRNRREGVCRCHHIKTRIRTTRLPMAPIPMTMRGMAGRQLKATLLPIYRLVTG